MIAKAKVERVEIASNSTKIVGTALYLSSDLSSNVHVLTEQDEYDAIGEFRRHSNGWQG